MNRIAMSDCMEGQVFFFIGGFSPSMESINPFGAKVLGLVSMLKVNQQIVGKTK
ncbi:MAG: hypothetical protein IT288_15550 [Bdellovibrionales bacterium]|nr:hypothetical protein [Bdellovibrionales bacterium]